MPHTLGKKVYQNKCSRDALIWSGNTCMIVHVFHIHICNTRHICEQDIYVIKDIYVIQDIYVIYDMYVIQGHIYNTRPYMSYQASIHFYCFFFTCHTDSHLIK